MNIDLLPILLKLWIPAVILCLFPSVPLNAAESSKTEVGDQPNIVIFISDDMGWNDVGYHGSEIQTPNIDSLAADGVRLDRFYVHPICSPTRTALMTSRSPVRFGIVGPLSGDRGVNVEEHFFPQSFQASGYQTALVGKWHLGPGTGDFSPTNRGFDSFYGHRGGMIDYYTHVGGRKLDWWRNDELIEEEGYSTNLIGSEAVRVIENRDPAKPLFLLVPFNAPHGPLQAPDELVEKYQSLGRRAVYAASVEAMDQEIGNILKAIDVAEITENTLVMFFCDNGAKADHSSAHPERGLALRGGKSSLLEGGIRVPTVLKWPKVVPPGSVSQQMISVLDLGPSLAAAADVTLQGEQPLEGTNQWPAILTSQPMEREPFVIAGGRGSYAVIQDPYKLIEDQEGTQLYHLRDDPTETKNLTDLHPEIVARLSAAWEPFSGFTRSKAGGKKAKGDKGKRKNKSAS